MTTTNSKHLVIFSVDALNHLDYEFIKTLPNFSRFIKEGTCIPKMTTVYPSLTYTCHTSIITGTYPNKHGIYANEIPVPHMCEEQPWHWHEKYIKVPTLFDYVKKENMTSGSVLWPVMTGAPITYNIPEIWSVTGSGFTKEMLSNTDKKMWLTLAKHAKKSKGKQQPFLDDFIEGCMTDILYKKPNLATVHLIELDQERHETGLIGPRKEMVLRRIDQRLGRLIETTKKAGYYDQTNFVILGDHGGVNFEKIVYLNKYFLDQGLITLNKSGKVSNWKAYANGCGGSVQVLIEPSLKGLERQKVVDIIGKLSCLPDTFVKNTYDAETANKKFNLEGQFDYVLEARDGFIFRSNIADKVVKHRASVKGSYMLEHGHDPNHPQLKTMFMAMGPGINHAATTKEARVIDIAPTIARLLDIEMSQVDGCVLEDILN